MLSIGLSNNSIRFLETDKENKISFASQVTDNFKFESLNHQNKLTDSAINETSEIINNVLKEIKTSPNNSKLVIDTNYCFTSVIPLDFSESSDKINSDIIWELSNYFSENYKNYKISYHKLLAESYSENIKETLIIAVRNNLIEAIKKLSKLINVKICSIDVEHFTAEKYFRNIRKNLFNGENFMVIGCRKNRFDFSIINESGCYNYSYFIVKDLNFQDNLIKTFLKIEYYFGYLQINNVYLYGDESTAVSYNILNNSSKKARIILSNPFYEVGITNNINPEIVSEGYKFIPLCGLALE
jgi:hypothetical protein